MKVFGDLELGLNGKQFADVVEQIDRLLPANPTYWQRNRTREQELSNIGGTMVCYAFKGSDKTPTLPPAEVWLYHNLEENTAEVSNIVPDKMGQLTHNQYNSILTKFHADLFELAASNLGLAAVLSKTGEVGIEDYVSSDSASALRSFSALANKSTGTSHPLDEERWFDFIISHHNHREDLPVNILSDWLVEHGWDLDSAREISIEFENGRDLLRQYESHKL